MYERFTDRARKVMQLANQEAQRLYHEYIGTEHILLGLVKEVSGVAANVLKNLHLDLRKIRLEVERLVQSGPDMVTMGKLPLTPRAQKVIEYSMEEARSLNHNYVGTEHILLGLLREDFGVAAQILMNFGLNMKVVRAEIEKVLYQPDDWGREKFSSLPPVQTTGERTEKVVELPEVCPKCGRAALVRVLWRCVHLSSKDQDDVTAGKAILGSLSDVGGPPWICLHCTPSWSEVLQLAMQDYQWQCAKEKAIAAMHFAAAAKYRDAQVDLRGRMHALINKLVQNQ
jgi:hypothetical protein